MNPQKCVFGRTFLLCSLFTIATSAAVAQTTTVDKVMQVDGNAAADSPSDTNCIYSSIAPLVPCDYWNLLNGNGTTTISKGHSLVSTFINGAANPAAFTGGGSKDPNPISDWSYSTGSVPAKDLLNDGAAALYAGDDSDFVLTFEANRASPSGDANIGIWFFQSPVTLGPNGTFVGSHMDGDIFVISAFTGGGGTSGIEVLKWESSCSAGVKNPGPGQCADTNLELVTSQGSSSSCAGLLYCAVTNAVTTGSTWDGSLASPLFFQGGINLNAALNSPESLPCFSSFLEETRSSQSTTAVLKDFLLGSFPVCGMSINKTCSSNSMSPVLVNNGTQVQYTWSGSVTNTGVGTISGITVTDTVGTNAATHPTLMLNGSTTSSLTAGETGTFTVTANVGALTATNVASASASVGGTTINATGPNGTTSVSATCTANVGSSVTVAKSCVAPGPGLSCSGSGCVVQVPIKAHVCNTSPVQLTGISLMDSPAVTFSPSSTISVLEPAGSTSDGVPTDCADVTATYTPTADSGDGMTNGRYQFMDTVSVTSATAAIPGVTIAPQAMCGGALACSTVSCPLCPQGECTTSPLP